MVPVSWLGAAARTGLVVLPVGALLGEGLAATHLLVARAVAPT